MQLEGKSDFDKTLERFEAWWHAQIVDRPPVHIGVHRERPPKMPTPKAYDSHRERWLDVDYMLDCIEASLEGAEFFADSFPMWMPAVGPEVCGTVFGFPNVTHCREILDLKPDLDSPYWSAVRRMTELSLERGRGKWITGITDLHTNGDLLASLCDPQDLCMDLADDPDSVRAACDYVNEFYPQMYEDLWSRIRAAGQPGTTWTQYLHDGPAYVSQCDFICMISPDHFRRALLPALIGELQYLDVSIYHLDGPGALRHLDTLLELDELNGIQWVYGAGNGPAANWIDLYQKIQAAGKCLQLLADDLDDAKTVCEQLRPEGVWICAGGGYTRDEAQAFLDWVDRWTAGKA